MSLPTACFVDDTVTCKQKEFQCETRTCKRCVPTFANRDKCSFQEDGVAIEIPRVRLSAHPTSVILAWNGSLLECADRFPITNEKELTMAHPSSRKNAFNKIVITHVLLPMPSSFFENRLGLGFLLRCCYRRDVLSLQVRAHCLESHRKKKLS